MAGEVSSWPRKHYQAGGGSAFLFYLVYGTDGPSQALSRSAYRVRGVPDEVDLMGYRAPERQDFLDFFRRDFLWGELEKRDASLAEVIAAQTECIAIRGEFPDQPDLDYLRDCVGIVSWLLDQGGVAVFDTQSFRWWSAAAWRKEIFEPAAAVPRHHVSILFSEDDGAEGCEWFHTRGMRKFGRPDLSVRGVTAGWRDQAIDLCERFIEFQAFGGIIEEGREIRMADVPEGLKCFHRGDIEDPDFNNVHIAIER